MSIRKVNKDHLREQAGALEAVPPQTRLEASRPQLEDPMKFWTFHEKETEPTDFKKFSTGELIPPVHGAHLWSGPFNGRPELTEQLLHAAKESLRRKAPDTVFTAVKSLKSWWRLFDAIEGEAGNAGRPIKPVRTVDDISELHRARAFQSMSPKDFTIFVNLVNVTRAALGLRQLHWSAPQERDVVRRIPDPAHSDLIRHALKHGWFAALSRWELAERLLGMSDDEFEREQNALVEQQTDRSEQAKRKLMARSEENARLRMNYQLYQVVTAALGRPAFDRKQCSEVSHCNFDRSGYSVSDMFRGFYPDPTDIRMAFFHCMASTGWNKEVLLDLDVESKFFEVLPAREPVAGEQREPERYLMTMRKDRAGGAEVYTEGMTKSRGSAGMVVKALIRQTSPLREQLCKDLQQLEITYAEFVKSGVDHETLLAKHRDLMQLRRSVRSPWLYYHSSSGIGALNSIIASQGGPTHFLRELVDDINKTRPGSDPVPYIAPEQFRDIFAAYIYRASGGSVLHVQHALGHKRLGSTQKYVNNNLIKAQSERNWRMLQQHFWQGVADGVVDPAILAKLCRDGHATADERQRLVEYRKLRQSRIGVRCKDPTSPPEHIDRSFVPNGKKRCVNHICTLCPENAVLAPDSWPGLSMRLAELRHIQARMSLAFFAPSSFAQELHNTEAALALFDPAMVSQRVALWEQRIKSGEHRIPDFPIIGGATS